MYFHPLLSIYSLNIYFVLVISRIQCSLISHRLQNGKLSDEILRQRNTIATCYSQHFRNRTQVVIIRSKAQSKQIRGNKWNLKRVRNWIELEEIAESILLYWLVLDCLLKGDQELMKWFSKKTNMQWFLWTRICDIWRAWMGFESLIIE